MSYQSTIKFVVLLGILFFLSGCFHKTQTNQNTNTASKVTLTLSPSPTPEEIEVIESDIDTSNWRTYRNEEYGFEVRYPEGWRVESESKSPIERALSARIVPPSQTEAHIVIEKIEIYAAFKEKPSWTKEEILSLDYQSSGVKDIILTYEKVDGSSTEYRTLIDSQNHFSKGLYAYEEQKEVQISIYIPQPKIKDKTYDIVLDSFKFF